MIIMANDQSLANYGYSIYQVGSEQYRLLQFGVIKLNSKTDYFERMLQIQQVLDELISSYKVEIFLAEEVQLQKNADTFRKLCYLLSFLRVYCYNRREQIQFYPPVAVNRWRKNCVRQILGLETGSKLELFNYLYNIMPAIQNTDQSDAVGLGIYMANELDINKGELRNGKLVNYKI